MKNLIDGLNMNNKIDEIIANNQLLKTNNPFFVATHKCRSISVEAGLQIAYNWFFITKTFMFTAIEGLGHFSDELMKLEHPTSEQLSVLQTAFSIIADDLNNAHPIFQEMAPKGAKGIHFKWWEDSILKKLQALSSSKTKQSKGTKKLLKNMKQYRKNAIGAAVQLRVVETIALDIAKSFMKLFGKIKHEGKLVFPKPKDKFWMASHIKAEVVHGKQVSNVHSGMALLPQSRKEQEKMLLMVDQYCQSWFAALNDFYCSYQSSH